MHFRWYLTPSSYQNKIKRAWNSNERVRIKQASSKRVQASLLKTKIGKGGKRLQSVEQEIKELKECNDELHNKIKVLQCKLKQN